MNLPVFLRPEAELDLAAARDWYTRQRSGLGAEFIAAAEELIDRVGAMPEVYAIVLNGVRRAKLRRFPYLLYYRTLNDRVEVLAVLHGSRDPSIWQRRV